MRAARHASALALASLALALGGCSDSHARGIDSGDANTDDTGLGGGVDAAELDDAGSDAPIDAACVPMRIVSRACHMRWAHAIGPPTADYASFELWWPTAIADSDDSALFLLIDGPAFQWAGRDIRGRVSPPGTSWISTTTVGLGADGAIEWTRGDTFPLAALGSDLWLDSSEAGRALDVVHASDGTLVRSIALPAMSDWTRVFAVGATAAHGTRWASAFEWYARIDLGALGVRTGMHGWTLLGGDDASVLWDATFAVEGWWPSPLRVEPDGTTVVVWYASSVVVDPLCPMPGICGSGSATGIVVRYDATGTPISALVVPGYEGFGDVSLADGGRITSFAGLARLRADESVAWRQDAAGEGAFAVDERAGVVWRAVPIPRGFTWTIGDATVSDCDCVPGTYSRTSLLARIDLATGAVIDVRLPAEGFEIARVVVRSDSSVLVAGHTHTRGDPSAPQATLELCGQPVTPEVGDHDTLVVAVIE